MYYFNRIDRLHLFHILASKNAKRRYFLVKSNAFVKRWIITEKNAKKYGADEKKWQGDREWLLKSVWLLKRMQRRTYRLSCESLSWNSSPDSMLLVLTMLSEYLLSPIVTDEERMTAGDSLNETNLRIKALQSTEVIRASEVSHIAFTDIQKSLEKTPSQRT